MLWNGDHEIVAEATDGAEAVDVYCKEKPEILLLDLAMPKKDGLTVVKEVIQFDPNAKIILITASDDQKVIRQCLEHPHLHTFQNHLISMVS